MGGFWTSHVLGWQRRRMTALVVVATIMAVWYLFFLDHSPRVQTDSAFATVVEVRETGWQLRLDTGEAVWIYASPGVTVKEGDVIPVRIDTYESGTRRVEFERDKWLLGG